MIRTDLSTRTTSKIRQRSSVRVWISTGLLMLPMLFYVSQIGRWSLDLDEFYTFRDASQPLTTILGYDKPVYYFVCHFLIAANLPEEIAIRLPSALAAGLIAPCYYWLGRRKTNPNEAIVTSILVAFHPWIFQHSQYGRFYTFVLLFASVAVLSLYRWVLSKRVGWIVSFFAFTSIAILTHATSAALIPAAAIGLLGYFWIEDYEMLRDAITRFRKQIAITTVLVLFVAVIVVFRPFVDWVNAEHGQYGNYSVVAVVLGFVAFSGLPYWAIGIVPLILKPRREWIGDDLFLTGMLFGIAAPFVLLAQFGGGVAPRYLIAAAPLLFLLAGRHWALLNSQLPSVRYQLAVGAAILAAAVPTFASTLKDGNHCDYRAAARFIDELKLEHPIVVCSAHQLLEHYLTKDVELHELRMLDDLSRPPAANSNGVAQALYAAERQAIETGRPLVLVSREDRRNRPPSVQNWFNARFAELAKFERPRFDHRRNQMVIYEYRPSEW